MKLSRALLVLLAKIMTTEKVKSTFLVITPKVVTFRQWLRKIDAPVTMHIYKTKKADNQISFLQKSMSLRSRDRMTNWIGTMQDWQIF